ncbi:MAG: ribosome maturation factor RimP [Alphaproteobacteria bacterium]
MSIEQRIEDLLTPAVADLGYDIVRVQLQGTTRKVLEIMIERHDRQPVSIKDCAKASREISTHLEVADPIETAYVLEVSSPGFDRPLTKKKDFERFAGSVIKLKTHNAQDGRKKFSGTLKGVSGENVDLLVTADSGEECTVSIALDNINTAKIVPDYGKTK